MIDYIKATIYNCKDSNFLSNSKPSVQYASGWECYYLQGCKEMKVWYNPKNRMLRLEGSLPYFVKGHNWCFTNEEFAEAVELIDSLLGNVGLWDAELNTFENGIIVPTEAKPKEYIARHTASKGTQLKLYKDERKAGKLSIWQRKGEADLKMYDAGANIKRKQGLQQARAIIEGAGWDPEKDYLKFEVRYLKPELLNNGRAVTLEMLKHDKFVNMLKGEIMERYHLLTPERALMRPTDKKEMQSIDAVIITFADMLMNSQGLSLEEVKKQIYKTINDAECLNKADKDARKAQIRKCFARLQESPESKWDLTAKLDTALDAEI